MGLESTTYIDGLVVTNPIGATDPKGQGDDHIRLIKSALKATFPNITGPVTANQAALNGAPFPAGTRALFQQTAAPTGWTKDVTHNNKALRIVNGTVTTGGTVAFTTAFASQAVAGTNAGVALTEAQLASHTHTQQGTFVSGNVSADHTHTFNVNSGTESASHTHNFTYNNVASGGGGTQSTGGAGGGATSQATGVENSTHVHAVAGTTSGISANHTHTITIAGLVTTTGSDATHTHAFTGTAINLAVQYVDFIIATKD